MDYCCDIMKQHLEHKCDQHNDPHECPDFVVARFGKNIGIPIRDGGSSYSKIDFCPWCGSNVDEMDDSFCCECEKEAQYIRHTQFAGDHPFCEEHAKEQDDFMKDDDTYFFWEEISQVGKKQS